MQLIVSGGQLYEVEPWRSGFYLKGLICEKEGYDDPDIFSLSCNGKPLKDDRCLDQQGVTERSQICLHKTGKGGINKWTVIFWLAVIVYTATLFMLMGTGVFNMIGYLYAFFFKWGSNYILKKLFGLFKGEGLVACLRTPLTWLLWGINFAVKHSIVFIFVYTALAALSYPLFGIRYKDHCQALYLSKKIGVISAVLYIFIYGLLNVPNLLYNTAMLVAGLSGTGKTIVNPALQAQKDTVDDAKYLGFYAIPFVGQGIEQLHFIITQIVDSVYSGDEMLKGADCTDSRSIARVARIVDQIDGCLEPGQKTTLRTCEAYKGLIQVIKNNKMRDMLKYAYMGLNPEVYKTVEHRYENAGFFTKIDILGLTKIGNDYFGATASRWIICSILSAINETDDYFDYIGNNADAIIDTIKMGNIAGMFTTLGYVISLIIAMIWPGFLGYL